MQQIQRKPFKSNISHLISVKGNVIPCCMWIYSSCLFLVIASATWHKIVLGSEVAEYKEGEEKRILGYLSGYF